MRIILVTIRSKNNTIGIVNLTVSGNSLNRGSMNELKMTSIMQNCRKLQAYRKYFLAYYSD